MCLVYLCMYAKCVIHEEVKIRRQITCCWLQVGVTCLSWVPKQQGVLNVDSSLQPTNFYLKANDQVPQFLLYGCVYSMYNFLLTLKYSSLFNCNSHKENCNCI